jgi:hypothetical protein
VPSTVTNLTDHDPGSLRDAIAATPTGGTVEFQPGLSGTIILTSGTLAIAQDITIAGPGSGVITISGNNQFQVFDIAPEVSARIAGLAIANGLNPGGDGNGISNSGTLAISACAISSNGSTPPPAFTGRGGGIYNAGTLTITASTISGNTIGSASPAVGSAKGGGIYNAGTLAVTNSTLSGNFVQSGLTLMPTDSFGGAIYNAGTLTVTDSTLSGNQGSNGGGGIYNSGTARLTGSELDGNGAQRGPGQGGGIFNDSLGTLTLIASTLSGNGGPFGYGQGGGIFNLGTLSIIGSSLRGNAITGDHGGGGSGGGIWSSGTLTIFASTISGNDAHQGGGIYTSGTLTLMASTVSGNRSGGVSSASGSGIWNSGTLAIIASTISGNQAGSLAGSSEGGGILNSGSLTVIESTLSGNSLDGTSGENRGGGIYNSGTVSVVSSTINGNRIGPTSPGDTRSTGGGIYTSGTLRIQNTILAGNRSPRVAPEVAGTLNSLGHNLIGDGGGGTGYADTDLVGTSAIPLDPKLGPLQDNGGPTQTMALLPGSPAFDAGALTDSEWDERGSGYARLVNGTTDIGAYEVQNGQGTGRSALPLGSPSPTVRVLGAPTHQALSPIPAPGAPSTLSVPSRSAVAAVERFFASRSPETGVLLFRPRQHFPDDAGRWTLDLFAVDSRVLLW